MPPCTRKSCRSDNNYFGPPSSETLPAVPSLESLHRTHRSKTEHERGGSERGCQEKGILHVKKKILVIKIKATHKPKTASHVIYKNGWGKKDADNLPACV